MLSFQEAGARARNRAHGATVWLGFQIVYTRRITVVNGGERSFGKHRIMLYQEPLIVPIHNPTGIAVRGSINFSVRIRLRATT